MLFEIENGNIIESKKTKIFKNDVFEAYWEGFIFIEGKAPGEPSIEIFLDHLKTTPIEDACELLHGIFACLIKNKKTDVFYAFSDNIGIFNFFKSLKGISTSFLDLIKYNQLNKSDINHEFVNDFVLATACMGWKTFFNTIKKIRYDEILKFNKKEHFVLRKNLIDLFKIQKCSKTIVEKFVPIVKSLRKLNGKISVDLSGGLDTRLIATILDSLNLDFETAISGVPGNIDVEISKIVARVLNKAHYITYHNVNPLKIEKELDDCFNLFEGLSDIITWHRYYQFQMDKKKRGCILTITGHAGELYKYEFIWNTKNNDPITTIRQLITWGSWIRYGISFGTIPYEIFSDDFKTYSMNYKNRIIKYLLKNYGKDDSGKTAPKIYVYFMEGSRTANMGPIIDRYSPLLDRSIIPSGTTLKYGKMNFWEGFKRMIQQPWDNRFTFQRKYMTYLNPQVAKINTTYTMGYSISTKRIEEIKRLFHHYMTTFTKKINKGASKIISANHPDLYPIVKSLGKTEDLIEILKNENILNRKTRVEDINDLYFGSLYTVAKMIEFCEKLH